MASIDLRICPIEPFTAYSKKIASSVEQRLFQLVEKRCLVLYILNGKAVPEEPGDLIAVHTVTLEQPDESVGNGLCCRHSPFANPIDKPPGFLDDIEGT
ncbi:MAG: hypothetical protein C0466_07960 [Candidatus Accumulibacter sp.]|nr:hypothetical protein [Accumulibacter sp.]